MTAADFRIEGARSAIVNGKTKIIFDAYRRQGERFVFVGLCSAPARTPKRDLWKFVVKLLQ